MPEIPPAELGERLRSRLELAARRLGARESGHGETRAAAQRHAEGLRSAVAFALEGFNKTAAEAGAPQLRIEVSPLRVDDKHIRSVEFELRRGRHVAIVTVKSRGETTLVGPFRAGKVEGPCASFAFGAHDELGAALGDFLERFVEEAATP